MTKYLLLLAYVGACVTELDSSPISNGYDPNVDPWQDIERIEREGPPRYTSRVHSCAKVRYATLGNVLTSRGVNLSTSDLLSAGKIYTDGAGALGAPDYGKRVREPEELGVATTSKLFDIFAQAAPEIIAAMPSRAACKQGGSGVQLFDAQNKCVAAGITCLIGIPATQLHVDLCNQTVERAGDVALGKRLAVAVLAAAAHTCE